VALPDTQEVVELSYNYELMKDPEEDPEKDPKEDPELGEHQVDHDVEDAELGVSDSSFYSGEELGDESDPDYDPSRDR